jgi:hypothetical protein
MSMTTEQWIIGGGAGLCLALIAVALAPDDMWDGDAGAPGQMAANAAISGAPSRNAGQGTAWTRDTAMPGMIPFTRARTERFRGNIVEALKRGTDVGWGQVHIWVRNGAGGAQQISLAPDWYLQYTGCPIQPNMRIKGTAFRFDRVSSRVALYARTIKVGGKTCRLRNDEGLALWSSRLR